MDKNPEVTLLPDNAVKFNSGQLMKNVHGPDLCAGRACPIHRPSEHEFRGYPLRFNGHHMVRLIGVTPVVDPDDYFFNRDGVAILRNSILCLRCGGSAESIRKNHLAFCPCKSVGVDGGSFYLKRLGNREDFIDTSLVASKVIEK